MLALQGLDKTLRPKRPRDGRVQSTSGSLRTRRRASETAWVARPPGETRQHWNAPQQRRLVKTSSTRWMPAGLNLAGWKGQRPLAAEVQSSSPRRPRESAAVRNQLNSSQNANDGCQLAGISTVVHDRADDAEVRTRDHASATRHRSRMSRDHAAAWTDRRSRTPPVAISIHDDAPRREQQLPKTPEAPARSAQRIRFKLQKPSEASFLSASNRSWAAATRCGLQASDGCGLFQPSGAYSE